MDLDEMSAKVQAYMDALIILEGLFDDTNETIKDHFDSIREKIRIITQAIEKIKENLMKQTESMPIFNNLEAAIQKLQERADYIYRNAPEKVISKMDSKNSMPFNTESNITNQTNELSPLPSSWSEIGSPCNVSSVLRPHNKKNNIAQTIRPVTETEINSVPKYMRGRMTSASVNNFIDAFNEAVTKKYEILKQPKSMIKKKDLDRYYKWKRDENQQPKGSFFITPDDLNQVGNLKMDKLAYNTITVLRHLKRVRESRPGVGLIYFIVI